MIHYAFLDETVFISRPDLAKQIIDLYLSNDWWGSVPEDPDLVRRLMAGSHCFIVAEEEDRIVGMGRAISDGVSDAYIQDVTVCPDRRGAGIGTELIRRIVTRLRADGIGWIGLIAEKNSHPFYQRMGFDPMANAVAMLFKGYP